MAQSELTTRLLKPLCYSFPGRPTCLAYDEKNEHIAVGFRNGKVSVLCKNGQVKVLSHSLPIKQDDSDSIEQAKQELCEQMSFCYYETTNKTFLVTILKKNSRVFLWSFTEKSECVAKFIGDRITVLTWSPLSSTLYVGTRDGDVIMLKVTDSPSLDLIEPDKEPLVTTRMYGQVVAVKESPNQDIVLVVYSTGICLVISKEARVIDEYDPKPKREPVNGWWKNNDTFILLSKTGFFEVIKYKPGVQVRFTQLGELISVGNSGITKAQRIYIPTTKETVAVCAGGYYAPEMFDKSHVISTFYTKNGQASDYPLKPFSDPVVDFVLAQDKKSKESLLVVLTESKINLVSPTNGNFEKDGGVNLLQYDRYDPLVSGYPYITQPITCIHFFGECSKEFIASYLSEEQSEATPELVVTGHSDGSIRLWFCYYIDGSLSFKLIRFMVVNTERYFEQEQKKLPAVSHVKVIDSQYLLVIKESGHVLLFRLWKTEPNDKPQSQEVVLKEYGDSVSKPLKTPFPHFQPPKEPHNHVQLLQHFSCHYQSDPDQPLVPVVVNCVEYNEKIGMLAVGTQKGLAVLDIQNNILVQVIGSDKKLLKLSHGSEKDFKNCDKDNCDVVCLETAMISWKDKEEAQLTLWVGTRGGSLGVFNLEKEGRKLAKEQVKVLELKATEQGKHFNKPLRGIHFDHSMEPVEIEGHPETEFTVKYIEFFTSTIAVTFEKDISAYQIPQTVPKEKTKKYEHGNIVWRGLVQSQDKPFIIYVTRTGQLAGFSMSGCDFKNSFQKTLPDGCQIDEQALFSSNGKHVIMKFSDHFYYTMDSTN